jgi:hypothetical protein
MTRIDVALFNFQDVLSALMACLNVAGRAPQPSVRPGQFAAGSSPGLVSPSTCGDAP